MNQLQRASVLLNLIETLRSKGSWASETHLQKSTYFLQGLLGVPLKFQFILYKHGPFSFDLREELSGMLADSFLKWEPQYPYGPSLEPGPASENLKRQIKTASRFSKQVEFVAEKLGEKKVVELERLSTALFVTLEEEGVNIADRAVRISKLKPHIKISDAREAAREMDAIRDEAQALS